MPKGSASHFEHQIKTQFLNVIFSTHPEGGQNGKLWDLAGRCYHRHHVTE